MQGEIVLLLIMTMSTQKKLKNSKPAYKKQAYCKNIIVRF